MRNTDNFDTLSVAKITTGGQISLPAKVRKRWGTKRVVIDDRGDELVVWPLPDDPIKAARGAWKDLGLPPTEELRRRAREDEQIAERRKWGV